jgi:hypothetical protein
LAFAVTAFALAACNQGNINDLYGLPVATAAPTATPAPPNPAITAATVTVTVSSSPLPNQPVTLYSSDASKHIGSPIATQTTGPSGTTTFTNLTGAAYYCFGTVYTPPSPSGSLQEQPTICENTWQGGVLISM